MMFYRPHEAPLNMEIWTVVLLGVPGALLGVPLRDPTGCKLFIAAPARHVLDAALAPWRRVECRYVRAEVADVILPGGTMALLAIALEQWGLPPSSDTPVSIL